jgi:hypothetical protein
MGQRFLRAATHSESACAKIWTALKDAWRETCGAEPYRPESHYMRGPGPKWRAKYSQAIVPNSEKR